MAALGTFGLWHTWHEWGMVYEEEGLFIIVLVLGSVFFIWGVFYFFHRIA